MARISAIWVAALLAVTGCTASGAPASPSSSRPATPVATTGTTPTAPATPEVTATTMPAPDGKPMLWPTTYDSTGLSDNGDREAQQYGFVDVRGRLVVSTHLDSYALCAGKDARVAFAIALHADARAEVLDLDGRTLRRLSTNAASCAGPGQVVISAESPTESGVHDDGLVEADTGDVVVPLARNRHLTGLWPGVVNVSDPSGEYFLDIATGKRTAHPGWLVDGQGFDGGSLVPAQTGGKRDSTGAKLGYLDRNGKWAVAPRFTDAEPFIGGRAIVATGDTSTFLDEKSLATTGGTWDRIDDAYLDDNADGSLVVGYVATRGEDQALLGPDLTVLVAPGEQTITCDSDTQGACSVDHDDGAELVQLPKGTRTPMPDGFTDALSPAALTDRAGRKLYLLASSTTITLPASSECHAAGTAFIECTPTEGMSPPMVFDTAGRLTEFSSATAVLNPLATSAPTYYWVTAGHFQGFVDARGTWHYREDRYNRLED